MGTEIGVERTANMLMVVISAVRSEHFLYE